MNGYPLARSGAHDFVSEIRFPDFDVSWVGPGREDGEICFGSDDGRIRLTDLDGGHSRSLNNALKSGEAVNGVAFIRNRMMVSSRAEIMLWTLPSDKPGQKAEGDLIPFGSHGAIAGPNGYFFAPLGLKGFLLCLPQQGEHQGFSVNEAGQGSLYFYRLIGLRAESGQAIIASALRRGGIGMMEFKGEDQQHIVSSYTFGGLDVIDLCPINVGDGSGIVALGKDGTLILYADAIKDREPVTIKYPNPAIQGVAYRVLSAGNVLFVLTHEALYCVFDLISNVLIGKSHSAVTVVRALPMEAVDANLVGGKWLFVILPDRILRLNVEMLQFVPSADGSTNGVVRMTPDRLQPEWEYRELAHSAI